MELVKCEVRDWSVAGEHRAVHLDEHGRVVEAYPHQTSLDRSMGDLPAKKWRAQFERASLTAVETWRYDLTEFVGGQVMSQTAIVRSRSRSARHRHGPFGASTCQVR